MGPFAFLVHIVMSVWIPGVDERVEHLSCIAKLRIEEGYIAQPETGKACVVNQLRHAGVVFQRR